MARTTVRRLSQWNAPKITLAGVIFLAAIWGGQIWWQTAPSAEAAYTIGNSLRFVSGSTQYLTRTPAGAGNRQKWTWSGWVKRGALSGATSQYLFEGFQDGNNRDLLVICGTDCGGSNGENIAYIRLVGGVVAGSKYTSPLLRDPAGWAHIVLAVDTTQSDPTLRARLYVNGNELTTYISSSSITQNANTFVNATNVQTIGRYSGGSSYFNGYLADIYLVDGQQLTPDSFGQFDANGYWRPKSYSGSYGTNGFKLDFSNSADLGNDVSGGTNDWTPNNFNTYDQTIDTPTNGFATLNPLWTDSVVSGGCSAYSITHGNLRLNLNGGNHCHTRNTVAVPASGKWYWEGTLTTASGGADMFGIVSTVNDWTVAGTQFCAYGSNAQQYGGSGGAYGAAYTTGDTISILVDQDAGTLTFWKNGVSQGAASGCGSLLSSIPLYSYQYLNVASNAASTLNFGQGGQTGLTYYSDAGGYFKYQPPAGYKALSLANLPAPAVTVPKNYFDAKTYTGQGISASVHADEKVIFLTSGSAWVVPADWNSADNSVEVIGAGGGGAGGSSLSYGSTGGGGGAYAASSNVSLSPGATVTYAVGSGGSGGAVNAAGSAGGDTYFCNSTSNCTAITGSAVVAGGKGGAGGLVGNGSAQYASGGAASPSSVGDVTYAGGNSGTQGNDNGSTGGGGAGGPSGAGAAGGSMSGPYQGGTGGGGGGGGSAGATSVSTTGGAGGNNRASTGGGSAGAGAGANGGGGGGGSSGASAGGAGGAGVEWLQTLNNARAGAGGGGGGGFGQNGVGANVGGAGGLYGGGGGAGGGSTSGSQAGTAGAQGIIVITYTPAETNYTSFTPALVWLKDRSATNVHGLFDSLRLVDATTTVVLTSGSSWTVPADWDSSNNTIEVIGGGGGGSSANQGNWAGVGGGGGAYSKIINTALTPGASITYSVGSGGSGGTGNNGTGGTGGDTYFNGASCGAASVCAKAGAGGGTSSSGFPGAGGAAASGVGTTKYSGGTGGSATVRGGSGGGGAGGPAGNGGAGGTNSNSYPTAAFGGGGGGGGGGGSNAPLASGNNGGTGGNNSSGSGGGAGGGANTAGTAGSSGGGGGGAGGNSSSGTGRNGGAGGAGVEWGSHGSGGGGGGGSSGVDNDASSRVGGAGGLYGGGGGGGPYFSNGNGGAGAQGIIVIKYKPAFASYPYWSSNATTAETTDVNSLTAFSSSGFSLGTSAVFNASGHNYISWLWKRDASTAKVDIVTYTGDNTSNRNINHSLGAAPESVIVKRRDSTGDPYVWHTGLTGATYFTLLDSTIAQSNTNTPWGTGNFSATQFMVTNNATNNLNAAGATYVAYLFRGVDGYSKFGTYTGNGSADGPFVYTGFKPRYVMIKRTNTTASWIVFDTARNTYNPLGSYILPDTSGAEGTGASSFDFLSNGFKMRSTSVDSNASGSPYIYAAFAEQPLKYSAASAASGLSAVRSIVSFLIGMEF